MTYSYMKKRLEYDFSGKSKELESDTLSARPYLDFYGLKTTPFTITPDPEFLYSSTSHKAAIENIFYGIEACMGFMLLIGEVGTGKTTLCRAILDKLEGKAETVYIINPSLTGVEIIQAILDDLGFEYPDDSSKKYLLDRLNYFLLEVATEKPVVIIIDDAQTMTPEGLENLRLLSNLETDKKKLVQLVLAGQQELQELLSRPELRQLKQRIPICCQLDLIGYDELKQYISLRLFVAGDNGKINFSEAAIKEIYKASKGIPRLINIICDYALTAGYVSESYIIKKEHARRALNELRHQSLVDNRFLSSLFTFPKEKRVWLELLVLFIGLLFLVFTYMGKKIDNEPKPIVTQPKSETLHITDSPAPDSNNEVIKAGKLPIVKDSEDISSTDSNSTIIENNSGSAVKTTENYIVQLSSLKNLKAAIREVKSLRQEGLDVHWNTIHLIKKGTWYRIYHGGFSTIKEAIAFKKEKGIPKGIVLSAPWTILVTSRDRSGKAEDIYSVLQENGIDSIIENVGDTGYRVTSGAFISYERAQKAVSKILDTGLDAKPVPR